MLASRVILCLDLDAFFASVEELLHPEWRGQPILVGGRPEERGVVASCSYPARRCGVHSAMPMGQALRLCPQAILAPPRHGLYGDYSRRVMELIREYGCPMQAVSVDEVFLDVTDCAGQWAGGPGLGAELKRRIHQEIGLNCTVGIASNKLVAKIASNQGKPDGLVTVPPGTEADYLAPLPVSRLWGIGPKAAARLQGMGLNTAGAVQQASLAWLRREFGDWAAELHTKARGIDTSPVETEREVKSISRETTFVRDVGDRQELLRVLLDLAEQVARDLRAQGLQARTVGIKLRWPDRKTITRQTTLPRPTNLTTDIYQAAADLLSGVPRGKVRLLGVRATQLAAGRQLGLFDEDDDKQARLERAVDSIRERFGESAIRRATLVRRKRSRPPGQA